MGIKKKVSYTSFLIYLNVLFLFFIIFVPLFSAVIFGGISFYLNYYFIRDSILILLFTISGLSVIYYVLWIKKRDIHDVVLFSLLLFALIYLGLDIIFWKINHSYERYLLDFFVQGGLLSLLIYSAEVEKEHENSKRV